MLAEVGMVTVTHINKTKIYNYNLKNPLYYSQDLKT